MKATHLRSGEDAESIALVHLESNGLSLLERNYTTKFGEIDLIMLQANNLVFIEVRYRKSNAFGGAIESITLEKQKKIRRTAESYLQKHPNLLFDQCRFDVIAISRNAGQIGKECDIDWIQHAF